MIAIGIDTHLKMHEIEAQDDDRRVLWRGKIENNRKGFETLREKIEVLTKSQKQDITGIYMNPTGNYHVPLKYFLSCLGYNIILVNPIISKSIRNVSGFGKGKTDAVDAHSLASTPWFKADIGNGHERSGISECNRRLIFVHFRRNKIDPHRRFNFDPCPCQDSGLNCTVWRCGE